jgi:ABC-type nitrate/sulfonate/bicarbonate transport system substrate-binding protein
MTQMFVAKNQGFFAAEGLNVTLTLNSSSTVIPAIVSGQADLGALGPSNALTPVKDGKETTIFMGQVGNGIAGFIVGGPKISNVTQCNKAGTHPVGTSVYAWAALYKKLFNTNYSIANFPDGPTVIAAVVSGQQDCGVVTASAATTAVAAGKVKMLFDPRVVGSRPAGFPQGLVESVFWGLTSTLKEKRSAIVKFVRAIIRANAFIKSSRPSDVATILRKDSAWQSFTQDQLTSIVATDVPFFAPDEGYISSSTWSVVLNFLQSGGYTFIDPSSPTWSYAKRVDMSYFTAAGGKATK